MATNRRRPRLRAVAGSGGKKGRGVPPEDLVAVLAAGASYADAAARTGLSTRTVERRMAESAFRHEVSMARASLIDRAVGIMAAGAADAAETLVALAARGTGRHGIRLSAARTILDVGGRLFETSELIRRVLVLEQKIAGSYGGRRIRR